MAEQPDFIRQQFEFAAHIRNPKQCAAPDGIEDRRMAIYRDLFFSNIEGFLASNFPVLKSILPDDHWQQIARDFFIKHRCKTPYFLEIGEEFIAYLQQVRLADPQDPDFMLELAHYEWSELALSVAEESDIPFEVNPNGSLSENIPVLSELVWNLSYLYPVHQISSDFIPDKKPDQLTHLVVYRDRNDDVKFLEINAVTQRLIQLMKEKPNASGLELITDIAKELGHKDAQPVITAGQQFLDDLRAKGIILGSRQI